MLVRIVVSAVALPLFLAVMFLAPAWAAPVLFALMGVMAQYELLHNTGFIKSRPVLALCMVFAAGLPFALYFRLPAAAVAAGLFALCAGLFAAGMFRRGGLSFEQISGSVFSAAVPPLFLSLVILISRMEHGKFLIILPYIAAWASDTGAYFIGTFFGRHKLCPEISPKKSVEGAVGGIFCAALAALVYGIALRGLTDLSPSLPVLAVIGGVGSAAGQFGDLVFSYIKRGFGIKDYGSFFPGHGGVLDRFDSVVFTTPLVYCILSVLPVFS